jgi:hypothetical protein
LQSKTLHHDVLNRVEQRLAESGLVTDLSRELSASESSPQKIRDAIGERPYLRAGGASALEDYRRIVAISEKFNEIVQFLANATKDALKKSPEYAQLQESVASAKQAAEGIKDRNQRAAGRAKAKETERQLEELSNKQVARLTNGC